MLSDACYEDYLSYTYALANRVCGDHPEVDVLVQETLMTLIIKERNGETVEHPKGFLSSVLRNKHNDRLRRRYSDRVVSDELLDTLPADEPPEDLSEEYTAVRREVGRLIAIYREVTVRHYMHGQSVEQIARELGIPKGTVLSRLSSARRQIKGRLEPYSNISYEPKRVNFGIEGGTGLNNEPFSLLSSNIEPNILALAYEHSVSVQGIADSIGIPCAYLEPIIDKLVRGELMGRTSGGLVYTRCFLTPYRERFGDIPIQEAVAVRHTEGVWAIVWRHIEPLMTHGEITCMTDKQKATLLLAVLAHSLSAVALRTQTACEGNARTLPERPNGGRWLLTGTVFAADEKREGRYDCSGPLTLSYRPDYGSSAVCSLFDYQSPFGDTHWRYNTLPYQCSLATLLRFYASFFTDEVCPDTALVYELIPALEQLHILRRDADGEVHADIPAVTFNEEEQFWAPAKARIVNELQALLEPDLRTLWNSFSRRVPKHIDASGHFSHAGSLEAYIPAQMRAIVEAGLLPYPVVMGETPIILLVVR